MMTLMMCLMFSTASYSQSINGTPLSDIESEYLLIVGYSNLLGTKIRINIDYGQEKKALKNTTTLTGSNGKAVKLNSMIDGLNFLSDYGYEFVNAYAISIGNQSVSHFLLRKIK